MQQALQQLIDQAWENRAQLSPASTESQLRDAVDAVIAGLDRGELRVAEKIAGRWQTHQWIKKAVLLSFRLQDNQVMPGACTQYYDKVPTKFSGYSAADFAAGGFRVVPELMSMVGCSGEEFASILKALGFKRERRKLMPEPSTAEAPAVAVEGEMAKSEAAEAAPPAEQFEEIWRPGKRKDARHAKRAGDQPKREHRPQDGKRERHRPQVQPKRERPVSVEHSPFAALKELRQTLVARRQERS